MSDHKANTLFQQTLLVNTNSTEHFGTGSFEEF
ncbi:hypothetical protein VCA_001437 [Vibrio albensis VL426]|nr:hypothetical protein VCA_001437 [Vibrio cholerae VL426]